MYETFDEINNSQLVHKFYDVHKKQELGFFPLFFISL